MRESSLSPSDTSTQRQKKINTGKLDDGRGSARSTVFTHKHESSSGRTSAVSHQLIGFDEKNEQVFVKRKLNGKLGKAFWNELVDRSRKQVVLIDLCGHRKYLKTTIFGLTGLNPDYAVVLIGSNMGIPRMTREHIGIACALKIPIIVVITKVDICPPNIFKQTMTKLKRILRNREKMPFVVNKPKKVHKAVELITTSTTTCPVFITSNVTGKGIDELRSFIGNLSKPAPILTASDFSSIVKNSTVSPPLVPSDTPSSPSSSLALDDNAKRKIFEQELSNRPAIFTVDSTFLVPGVGLVLSGNVRQGKIRLNDQLILGPSKTGDYVKIIVRGIHANRVSRDVVMAGKSASIAIRSVKKKTSISRDSIRKGMVVLSEKIDPEIRMTWKFQAEILILHHQTTCGKGYTPVIHCGVVRQSAKILSIQKTGKVELPRLKKQQKSKVKVDDDKENKDLLRTGDRALVDFEFCYYPEFLTIGTQMLFREGRAKGIGKITKIGGRSAGRSEDFIRRKKSGG